MSGLKLKILAAPWRAGKNYDKIVINDVGRLNFYKNRMDNDYDFTDVEFFSFAMQDNDPSVYLIPNADPNKKINLSRTKLSQPFITIKTMLDIYGIRYPDMVEYEVVDYEWEENDVRPVIKLKTSLRPPSSPHPLTKEKIIQSRIPAVNNNVKVVKQASTKQSVSKLVKKGPPLAPGKRGPYNKKNKH